MDWNAFVAAVLGAWFYEALALLITTVMIVLRTKRPDWANRVLYGLGACTFFFIILYVFAWRGVGWHLEWRGNDKDTLVAHRTGRAEADAWTVSARDPSGALQYGPYKELRAAGAYEAFWDVSLNERCPNDDEILSFDVFESDTRTIVDSLPVRPSAWGKRVTEFKRFRLGFHREPSEPTHKYEFRTLWRGGCGVTLKRFGVERKQ